MECPVCLEVFQTPLLLPGCGHTICSDCAHKLVTADNYLRCPECRLVYQLRRGVASLPKNIALQRTIDEQIRRSASRENLLLGAPVTTCEEHPGDAVSLYCKTCEKSICLKCYFSNTLRKGQTMHTGHQVDTSEDVYTKERRLLEENYNTCLERQFEEVGYIGKLQDTEVQLKTLLENKVQEIDKKKDELIGHVKKTAGKLKFTLKGSVARDTEFLQMTLQSAREREGMLQKLVNDTESLRDLADNEPLDINSMKEVRKKLEVLPALGESERPSVKQFLSVENFDTDLAPCLTDPKRALSYQTEPPREPEILENECIISNTTALIVVKYNETIRAKKLCLLYKEALYKGLSVKQWQSHDVTEMSKGSVQIALKDLERGTMYRMFAKAVNDFGESPPSKEVWFRTVDSEIEIRKT